MPIIPVINLSHNNLSGPLTNLPNGALDFFHYRDFGEPRLYLQNNNFNGSIPRSLCKRGDLNDLDLSRNRLTGQIPNCFKNMYSLQFLKLRSNRLSGIIPSSIVGPFPVLSVLQLSDNNFSGELPVELWNLSSLLVLDLGNNAFHGEIPEIRKTDKFDDSLWFLRETGVSDSLWILRLRNNNFTGRIPRSLCKNVGLQILDIAHNNFTGIIPCCLGELQGMVDSNIHYMEFFRDGAEEEFDQVMKGTTLEYTKTWYLVSNMDLSSNKLVEEIPVELTALQGLVGLNLSNNHLSGGIPNNIGNMTALNSLDLSGNKLDGPIPPNITALTFLSYLNLSNNNLSGPIPTGNQFLTFSTDPSIYAGNKGLCGAPLPKKCSHQDPTATAKNIYEAVDESNKVWFYVDIICGFATGFWGVIVVLMLKKQWRRKLFIFAEESTDKIHVAVMVRVNKMKRGREAT
ncbi:putative leucine-rich repeat domain superfamily [Helianthus debilis subsp. tardiflorus]